MLFRRRLGSRPCRSSVPRSRKGEGLRVEPENRCTVGQIFHSNRRRMCNGDIVCPGNYGKLVMEAGEDGPHWVREQVLERVRAEDYCEKPSRLNACFGTLSPEAALFYHQHHCSEGFAYLVQLVDSSAPHHIGDFNAVQPPPAGHPLANLTMEEVADKYWSNSLRFSIEGHQGLVCEELVTGSALRVLGRVNF